MKTTAKLHQDATREHYKAIATAIASKREDLFSARAYDRITDHIYAAWEAMHGSTEPDYDFRYNWVLSELDNVPELWRDVIDSAKFTTF